MSRVRSGARRGGAFLLLAARSALEALSMSAMACVHGLGVADNALDRTRAPSRKRAGRDVISHAIFGAVV